MLTCARDIYADRLNVDNGNDTGVNIRPVGIFDEAVNYHDALIRSTGKKFA
jgi:hypothetical protein